MNITKMLMLMGVVMGVSTGCLRADCGGCGDKGSAKCEKSEKGKRGGSSKCDEKSGHGNIMKELGLSDDQKEQIKALGKKNRESMKSLMKKMHELRTKMREASMNENVDEATIRTLSKELAESMADITILKGKMHKGMQAILTDEQKVKSKELRAKMREKMKSRKKSGKGRKGGFSQHMKKRRECK